MSHLLVQFAFLQLLDLLSTVVFLSRGVEEANPLVNWAMAAFPSPVGGVFIVKLVAIGLGVAVWRMGRHRLLSCANTFFAIIVTWNLVAVILVA